jgi:curved DNA-binding protein
MIASTFIDYYSVLQVRPNCDAKALEAAYHHLAKAHHPDHTGDVDTTIFNEITEAYRNLRNPGRRAKYDLQYANIHGREAFEPSTSSPLEVDERTALNDAEAHAKILMFLYKKRREQAQNAGVPAFYLQELVSSSDEHFGFHQWYLKEKGFVTITEQGTLAITIQGIDHVIATSKSTDAAKLLLAQSKTSEDLDRH